MFEAQANATAEAGRKGGQTTRDRYGNDHYSAIGKKGGRALAQRGPEFFAGIGKAGGLATKAKHGSEFFSAIGKKGGTTRRVRRQRAERSPESLARLEEHIARVRKQRG